MAAASGMPARALGQVDRAKRALLTPGVRTDPRRLAVTQPFCASDVRINSFLSSIRSGRPIDNGGPWSVQDLLILAGCAQAVIMSHPPGWIVRDGTREAVDIARAQEVLATIEFLSRVAAGAWLVGSARAAASPAW